MLPHPDPWRAIDRQSEPERYVRMMAGTKPRA